MELAAQDTSPVPTEHSANVRGSKGAGARAYPAIDVITTNAGSKIVYLDLAMLRKQSKIVLILIN